MRCSYPALGSKKETKIKEKCSLCRAAQNIHHNEPLTLAHFVIDAYLTYQLTMKKLQHRDLPFYIGNVDIQYQPHVLSRENLNVLEISREK